MFEIRGSLGNVVRRSLLLGEVDGPLEEVQVEAGTRQGVIIAYIGISLVDLYFIIDLPAYVFNYIKFNKYFQIGIFKKYSSYNLKNIIDLPAYVFQLYKI